MLLRGVGCQGGALAPFSFFGRVVHGGGTRPWVVRERSAEGGQPEDRWCFWTGLGVPGSLPSSIVGRIVLSSVALVSRARHAPPQVPDFPEGGHARDGGVGAVVGGRQEKRTLERPGRRSHAGAWERSPSDSPHAPLPRGGRLAPPGGRFGAGRVSGEENSPLALSRSAGCGTGKKGQAV